MSVVNVSLEVRELVCFAAAHDVQFCLTWQPRESAPSLHEDMLCSREDTFEVLLLSPLCLHWQDRAQSPYQRLVADVIVCSELSKHRHKTDLCSFQGTTC